MTKTLVTVCWSTTVQIEVDEARLNDKSYVEGLQIIAITKAWPNVQERDGVVTDCEDFSDLIE